MYLTILLMEPASLSIMTIGMVWPASMVLLQVHLLQQNPVVISWKISFPRQLGTARLNEVSFAPCIIPHSRRVIERAWRAWQKTWPLHNFRNLSRLFVSLP